MINFRTGIFWIIACSMGTAQGQQHDNFDETMQGLMELISPTQTVTNTPLPQQKIEKQLPTLTHQEEPEKKIEETPEKNMQSVSVPLKKIAKETEISVEAKDNVEQKTTKQRIDPLTKQNDCTLCIGNLRIEKQENINGGWKVKIIGDLTDKKGRLALNTSVQFKANNHVIPQQHETQTNINGEFIFTFTTFSSSKTQVELSTDGHRLLFDVDGI
ncbi:TPA: hypothetical protein ACKRTE_002787 [Providencia rettgeri]